MNTLPIHIRDIRQSLAFSTTRTATRSPAASGQAGGYRMNTLAIHIRDTRQSHVLSTTSTATASPSTVLAAAMRAGFA